jgi:hypothetical protein
MLGALIVLFLISTPAVAQEPREPLAAAVARAGKQLVWGHPSRPATVDKHNWIRVLRLPNGSRVRVITHDGVSRDLHLGDVSNDRMVLLSLSALPEEARRALLGLAANYPGYLGHPRRFSHGPVTVDGSGVIVDGVRVADFDAVFIEIPRSDVAEVKQPSRGSGIGSFAGFITGFTLGLRGALALGFKQCGNSCDDEKILAFLSVIAVPLGASYLGRRFVPHRAWTTVYRSR